MPIQAKTIEWLQAWQPSPVHPQVSRPANCLTLNGFTLAVETVFLQIIFLVTTCLTFYKLQTFVAVGFDFFCQLFTISIITNPEQQSPGLNITSTTLRTPVESCAIHNLHPHSMQQKCLKLNISSVPMNSKSFGSNNLRLHLGHFFSKMPHPATHLILLSDVISADPWHWRQQAN